jgi:hypothetical protein
VSERTIPPGGEGELKVTFNSKGRPGKAEKTVRLRTNDPDSPTSELRISALVDVVAGLEPRSLYLGEVEAGEKLEREVRITGRLAAMLKPTGVSSDGPLQVTMRDEGPDPAGAGHRLTLTITVKGPPQGGIARTSAFVKTDNAQHGALELPITAQIVGPIVARPYRVFASPPAPGQPVPLTFTLEARKDEKFEVLSAADERKRFTGTVVAVAAGQRYRVDCKVAADTPPDDVPRAIVQGNVVVRTSHPRAKEIRVPYTAVMRTPKLGPKGALPLVTPEH